MINAKYAKLNMSFFSTNIRKVRKEKNLTVFLSDLAT